MYAIYFVYIRGGIIPKVSVRGETKEERFKRIASARTMRILNDLIKDGILIEVNDDQSKNN